MILSSVDGPPTVPAGNDTVDVRVALERLPPPVQDGQKTDLGSQAPRVGGDFKQGRGTDVEQQLEQKLLFCQTSGTRAWGKLNTRW